MHAYVVVGRGGVGAGEAVGKGGGGCFILTVYLIIHTTRSTVRTTTLRVQSPDMDIVIFFFFKRETEGETEK